MSGYSTRLVTVLYKTYREHPGKDFPQRNTHGSMREMMSKVNLDEEWSNPVRVATSMSVCGL